MSGFRGRARSGSSRRSRSGKRIHDPDVAIDLSRIEVFGVQALGARRLGRLYDEGVPERQSVAALDLDRFENGLRAVDHDFPAGVVSDELSGLGDVQWPAGLAPHVHIELLKNLGAEHSRPL